MAENIVSTPSTSKRSIEDIIDVEIDAEEQAKRRLLEGIEKRPVPNFGALRSNIYQLFAWNDESRQWKCIICSKSYNHSSTGGSSTLIKHLQKEHSRALNEAGGIEALGEVIQKGSLEKFIKITPKRLNYKTVEPLTEEGFRRELLEFVVKTNQPFALTADDGFKQFVNYCVQDKLEIQMPSPPTLKSDMLKLYSEEKAKLQGELLNNVGKISFILDAWTSKTQKPFQGVVATWINNDWKLCSTVLDLTLLKGSHSGANLAKAFEEVLNEYDLWEKLLAVTTDNASNMDSMFLNLDGAARDKLVDFESEAYRVRCMAHIINLACQDILRMVTGSNVPSPEEIEDSLEFEDDDDILEPAKKTFLEKIRIAVSSIRKSPQRLERFEAECTRLEMVPKMLLLDVSTRWNSTLAMLRRVTEFKQPFLATVESIRKLRGFRLREDEDLWNRTSLLIQVLEPFEETTRMLSQGHSPNLSDVSVVFHCLFEHLEQYIDNKSGKFIGKSRSKSKNTSHHPEWLKAAANKGWQKLQKYYANCDSLVYVVATVMDPRYKLKWLSVSWEKEYVTAAKNKILNLWEMKYKRRDDEYDVPSKDPSNKKHIGDLIADKMKGFHKPEDELKKYLNDPVVNSKQIGNGIEGVLGWWKAHEPVYPSLSKMAKDFLAVSGTGVPVERLFSSAPDLLTVRRLRMKAETVQKALCLKQWVKNRDKIYSIPIINDAILDILHDAESDN